MEKELLEIYRERKRECIRLLDEGKAWEEMREIVDAMDFQQRIDALFPVKKTKSLDLVMCSKS